MVLFYHLSLTCRSIPHRRAHKIKKAVIPTPGLFIERKYALSFNNLCKEYRNLTYIASTKKPGYPHFKKTTTTTGDIVSRGQKHFAHTYMHTNEHNEKLILICLPSLYPQPSGPKLWPFPAGCIRLWIDGW